MAGAERNFSNYQLGDHEYQLAGGLLPEMATAMGYELSDEPNEQNLQGLVAHIGPAKWLQENITLAQERLATADDATTLAANWTERSGMLIPVERSFAHSDSGVPGKIDTAFISGGVARWMLRRTDLLTRWIGAGNEVGQVIVPVGTRAMKDSEHESVARMAAERGAAPTEQEFAKAVLTRSLVEAGVRVEVLDIDTSNGDELMREFAAQEGVMRGTVLAVANAPAAIQTAGQFRVAARELADSFDEDGRQLYVVSDGISVARHGEGPATHQNPYTALGQIARNALFLHRNK